LACTALIGSLNLFACELHEWLFLGGSTLYIESSLKQPVDTTKEDVQGSLQLTGHLGDVMKESAQIAHTVAKSFLGEIDPSNRFLQNAHIHIHVPEVCCFISF